MIDRSTPPVMIGETTRWPSNKIRLRLAPRLRRLTPETPRAPEFEALPLVPFSGVGELPMDGIWRSVSPISAFAAAASAAAPTTETGVGCW
jgi:hypothetical protein